MEYVFRSDAGVFSRRHVDPGTKLLIESVELHPGETVLDMGCGYGAVGVAVARMVPGGRVYMVDVNRRAVELTGVNLKLNRIPNAEVRQGDGFEPVSELMFDAVLMNPPVRSGKEVVYRLVEESLWHLKPGGALYVVIRTRQGAGSMRQKIQEMFNNSEDVEIKGGYRVIRGVKTQ